MNRLWEMDRLKIDLPETAAEFIAMLEDDQPRWIQWNGPMPNKSFNLGPGKTIDGSHTVID